MPNWHKAEGKVVGEIETSTSKVKTRSEFIDAPWILEWGFKLLHANCEGCELERNPLDDWPEELAEEELLGEHLGGSKCGVIVEVNDVYNALDDPAAALLLQGESEVVVNDHLTLRKKKE